ncbi:MAG: hypothetical protein Q4A17_15320 [Thermoguttaceae bacterium]|nr:hypothetical protein [Thermoguttaceae bacterium]
MLQIQEGIEIVDKNGVPKIRIAIGKYGDNEFPKIEILDDTGTPRISIGLEDNSSKIGLYTEDGNFAIGIGENADGGGLDAFANGSQYASAHLIPIKGEYRLIISRPPKTKQFYPDGSVSVVTDVFPQNGDRNEN